MNSSVEISELSVRFGDFTAVDRISFTVKKGEIFGFLGANGAGKTTTIRVLCGLLLPTSGKVSVAGVSFVDGIEAIKSKVGYMSQKFTLYNDLTIRENLSFTAGLRKLSKQTLKLRTDELFAFISFNRSLDNLVSELPGGVKQQVSLVASILHDPEIIFLDEPTAGVTPGARAKFWTLIRKLSEAGKTVFVTTHYMDEAEQCDRIALMRAGKIIALDIPEKLKENTFPEPLFELRVPENPPNDWLSRLKADLCITGIQPYGLRYHVVVNDLAGWDRTQQDLLKQFNIARIKPSLEDVFIRLVEGLNR